LLKINKVFSLFSLLLLSYGISPAQSVLKDSVLTTPDVIVRGSRLEEFDAGVKVVATDSLTKNNYRHNNLTTLLEQNTNIYIKSYGLGSLSTMSFRGAGAAQTSVLWNGFNLQSPMNGTLDLALVPVSLVEQVKVQYGGSGALWGSGSVSGSIHLDNKPVFGKGLSFRYSSSYGSFQTTSQLASISLSKKNFITSIKGFYSEAKNNFPYINTAQFGEPRTIQSNAALKQYGYMLDNYFRISKRNQFNVRLWQQYSNREIPPVMSVNLSDAVQKDWFVRLSTEFQHSRALSTWNVRLAYFDESLLYQDKLAAINSHNHSISQISEAETKITVFKNALLNIGVNNTYSTATVDSYEGRPVQNRSALFASFKCSNKKNTLKINVGARKEVVSSTRYNHLLWVPLMPFVGTDVSLTKKIILKSNISRNYRLPTFNDLYWVPGGNINLLPEQGWSEEVGLNFIHKNKNSTGKNSGTSGSRVSELLVSSTVFNRNIDNWILWIPNGSYWTPENVLKVWSRGMENSIDMVIDISTVKLKIGGRYDYVLSTNEKVPEGSESELQKQLIYVPLHKAGLKAGLNYKGYALSYMHNYTGWIYTQADNAAFIDPYWLGNMVFSKTFIKGKNGLDVLFKINNIWNKAYQVIAFRAMPGRNFEMGISIHFN
jgi:vitamin B12 transporter